MENPPIKNYLFENWERLFKNSKKPERISLMKIGGRPGKRSTVPFLIFTNRNRFPSYVLKTNRDPTYSKAIEDEYNNYLKIYEKLSEPMRRTVPAPIFIEKVGLNTVFCETALVGTKLGRQVFNSKNQRFKRRIITKFFDLSSQWLNKFHQETCSGFIQIDDDFIQKNIQEPINNIFKKYPTETTNLKKELLMIPEKIKIFRGKKVPIVGVHGDFDHWNIFITDNEVRVIDWEDCSPEGLPFSDLFYFLFHFSFVFDGRIHQRASFAAFFREDNWTYKLVRGFLEVSANQFNLDVGFLFTMAPVYSVELLLKNYEPHRVPESIPLNSFKALQMLLNLFHREASVN